MIFRNKDIKPEKSGCLICDDLLNIGLEPIPKELLENMPIPQKGESNQRNVWDIQHKGIAKSERVKT